VAKKRINRILSTGERRRRGRRRRFLKLYLYLFLLFLILCGLIYLVRAPYFRLNSVAVEGASEQKRSEIVAAANETFKGNKYLIVPNNQALFYSSETLKGKIEKEMIGVNDVIITVDFPRTLKIRINERAPNALFCQEKCYFIDASGLVYSEAPSFSEGVYMVYRDNTFAASSSPIGNRLANEEAFDLVNNYIEKLPDYGLTVTTVTFETKNEVRLDVKDNGHLLISLERSYEDTLANIKTVLDEGVTTFEYIDVRFGNKIFYKN
jgi:cell division septal protein FtsQ